MELLLVIAVLAALAGIGIPLILAGLENMRLNASARDVQSELQNARLLAVTANRPIRVRFDCPALAQFRVLELIGTAAVPDARDTAPDRCSEASYPYPAASQNPLAPPNHDGPVRRLQTGISFSVQQTIEFWADGTAHADGNAGTPWPAISPTGVTIRLTYKSSTKAITVNGVGKVNIQ